MQVRQAGIRVLFAARSLHQVLQETGPASGMGGGPVGRVSYSSRNGEQPVRVVLQAPRADTTSWVLLPCTANLTVVYCIYYQVLHVHLCATGGDTGMGTPTSILGPSSPFQSVSGTYMADVVDQLADSIVARCWWDTEPWAAMRQELAAAAAGQASAAPMSFNVSV